MFAPIPLWDRAPKKRRHGARAAARRQTSDPAADAGEPGAGAGVIGATTAAEPLDATYETQPAEAEVRPTSFLRNGVAAGALAAGIVVVAALGGVAWYASQSHAHGIAELTPGGPATSTIALNAAAAPANPMTTTSPPVSTGDSAPPSQESATPPAHSAAPVAPPRDTSQSLATRPPSPRVRPADSSSALSSGVDASAAAPTINTPPPAPIASPMQATPANPVNPMNPVAPAPVPAPSATTSPPAGMANDTGAPAGPTTTP